MLRSGGRGAGAKNKNTGMSQVFATGPARADREVYRRVLERFESRLQIDPINRSRLVTIQFDARMPRLQRESRIAWRKTT